MNMGHDQHTHTASQHFQDYRRGDGKVIYNRKVGGEETVNEGSIPSGQASIVQHYIGHDGIPTSVLERDGKTDVHRGFDQPARWPAGDPARVKWDLVQEAERLASSTDWKSAGDRFKSMTGTWKSTRADRSTESVLGDRFFAARKQFMDARQNHFEEQNRQREQAKSAKERLISEARGLVGREDKAAADRMRSLMDEWKSAGRADRADEDRLWGQFQTVREQFFAHRIRREEDARRTKERIASEALRLASSTDWKVTGDRFRALLDEWKKAGRASRDDEDRMWSSFERSRKQFQDARQRHFDERDREAKTALSRKQGIVSRAQSAAKSSDTRAAGDQMRSLMDEWKRAGRAPKADEDRLWSQFQAAQASLRGRRDQDRAKRERDQASSKALKQAIVSQAQALSHGPDFKASRERMRALTDQWKAAGRASRVDEDALWKQFQAARDALHQNSQAAFEQGKRERAQRLRESIDRMRSSLANIDNAIYNTERQYSEALSRPSPRWDHPRRWEIAERQNARISNLSNKLGGMKTRRAELISKISDMESKWRGMV